MYYLPIYILMVHIIHWYYCFYYIYINRKKHKKDYTVLNAIPMNKELRDQPSLYINESFEENDENLDYAKHNFFYNIINNDEL